MTMEKFVAAGAALLLAGLAFSAPGIAQDNEGAKDGTKIKKVIIIREGGETGGDKKVRVHSFGAEGTAEHGCTEGERVVDESSNAGDQKHRTILCIKGDSLTSAQRIEKLESAVTRIEANTELSAEHKERVTAALRAAISRMRAAN